MMLFLDTSESVCKVWLGEDYHEWEAGRELAVGLLGFLRKCAGDTENWWKDISGIGFFRGPGSFTGLRIGATVMNTLADANGLPIVGEVGEDWRAKARLRLENGDDDKIALPEYGAGPKITAPKRFA